MIVDHQDIAEIKEDICVDLFAQIRWDIWRNVFTLATALWLIPKLSNAKAICSKAKASHNSWFTESSYLRVSPSPSD